MASQVKDYRFKSNPSLQHVTFRNACAKFHVKFINEIIVRKLAHAGEKIY